ncbi:MAG: tetratricopeptide repeat protein [Dehalococcoidia bacterium]
MHSRKIAILLGIALVILLYTGVTNLLRTNADGVPSVAELTSFDEDSFLPPEPPSTAISLFQERLQIAPLSATNYAILGQQYLRQARESGDVADYGRAEAALRRSLQLLPRYAPARTSLAAALYAQHNFVESLQLSRSVYQEDPENLAALATLGDSQLALGRYAEAESTYETLLGRSPSPPVLVRLAGLEELKGNTREAQRLLSRATAQVLESQQSRSEAAWYLVRLGESYFGPSQLEEVAKLYQAALRLQPDSYLALAGLGQVRAAQGQYPEAIRHYQRSVVLRPDPAHLSELGDLYAKTGQMEQAEIQYDAVESIAQPSSQNRGVHNRELALFYADHDRRLDRALELAQQDLRLRQDIHGYDTLAWALFKKGRLTEAVQAIAEAMKLGTSEASIYYHAGLIHHGLGETQQARAYLVRALEINPHFSQLQADQARRLLAELDHKLAASAAAHVRRLPQVVTSEESW